MTSPEHFLIRQGTIEEVVHLSRHIPEFDNPHEAEEYHKRLANKPSLILIAEFKLEPVGFKVGYQKEDNGSFYSWMGAILPDYRGMGIAKELATFQENWARNQGYRSIRFKTRNYLKSMLIFGLKNNFSIVGVEPRENVHQNRILLEKSLND